MKLLKKLIDRQGSSGHEQFPSLELYKRSPSSYPGILPYSVDQLLESQQDILMRIRQAIPQGDDYYRYYLPLISRYATYVHLLPASQHHHHRAAGGLLAHGLEVAQQSISLFIESQLGAEPSRNGKAEHDGAELIALACFIGGLVHDLPKICSDMTISDGRDLVYRPFDLSLIDWLKKYQIGHYKVQFIQGRHKKHEHLIALTLDCILTEKIRSYLCSGGSDLSQKIFSGINGIGCNVITNCVTKADQLSVSNYMRATSHLPSPAIGTGLAPHEHLVSAMTRLFSAGLWDVNSPGGVAKLIDNHLYLVWPRAAEEMLSLLVADYIPAIPRDPDTVAQILHDWGIIDEGGLETPYRYIGSGCTPLKAVRLVGTSRWLSLLQGPVTEYRSSGEAKLQQPEAYKPLVALQRTGPGSVVSHFLQALTSPEPPFSVQAIGRNLYTQRKDAEKWFSQNGVSRSQMLRLIKSGELGLVKVRTNKGEGKMIGPPST